MNMASSIVVFLSLIMTLVFMAYPALASTKYVVGDNFGWSPTTDLSAWVSDKIFNVGDSLLFNYNGLHSVQVVSEDDYTKCNTGNPIKSYSNSATEIALQQPGTMYFISPTPSHCQGGMKMSIDIHPIIGSSTTTPVPPILDHNSPPNPNVGSPRNPRCGFPTNPGADNPGIGYDNPSGSTRKVPNAVFVIGFSLFVGILIAVLIY